MQALVDMWVRVWKKLEDNVIKTKITLGQEEKRNKRNLKIRKQSGSNKELWT